MVPRFSKGKSVLNRSVAADGTMDTSPSGPGAGRKSTGQWNKEADVVVLGAGLAGLSAAIEAADAGAKVILLEKMSSVTSSHTTRCVGNVAGAGSKMQIRAGITDSPQRWREDILRLGEARLMPSELLDILTGSGGAHIDWLQEMGVPFAYICYRPPDSIPRGHIVEGDAQPLGTVLAERGKERGVEILLETRALKLYRGTDNRIGGVVAEDKKGERITVKARKGVILCTGDYSASKEIKAKFTSIFENVNAETAGNPGNTGDGFKMAWAVGADSACLDEVGDLKDMFMFPDQPRGTGISEYLIQAGAIIVNKDGERFQNEEISVGGKAIRKQPDGVAFVIFDSKAAATDVVPEGAPKGRGPWICTCRYLDDWRKFPGAVKEAKTIEALAGKLGIDSSGLSKTIHKYNSYSDAGQDPDFGRIDPGSGIRKPPYIGLGPGRPMTYRSEGTLMVNSKHQVLDVFGRIIPGLYAAGDMGRSGKIVAHGTHTAWACISGRRSGRFAATRLSSG